MFLQCACVSILRAEKKTAIRMVFPSSTRFSRGKDQPMCLTWLDESRAWVLRKSLFQKQNQA
jgi:hypothetical protein